MATCTKCNSYFTRGADETWKKLCIPCWRECKRSDARDNLSEPANTIDTVLSNWKVLPDDEITKLKQYSRTLQNELDEAKRKISIISLELTLERSAKSGTGKFIADNIKALLLLCHPDKHNNNRQATTVTSWLIDFKRRM